MRNLIEKKVVVNRVNRGITLLLVLALMTIFSMLVVTFMIVTSAAKNMALKQAQALLDPKERELSSLKDDSDKAIETLLYGNSDSPIGTLSILENLYGNGHVNGSILPASATELAFETSATAPISNNHRRIYWSGSYSQFQLGHVLTLTTFRLSGYLNQVQKGIEDRYKNRSVLVKGYGVDSYGQYIDIEKFADSDKKDFDDLHKDTGGTWAFIINSPAFSGTGEGVNVGAMPGVPVLSDMTAKYGTPSLDRVFLPNEVGYGKSRNSINGREVMMNPDYTAPDHLTWFLAWYDIEHETDTNTGKIKGTINSIIPSFHRPQIIKYLYNDLVNRPEALKAATLRPLPTEHPKFTGSNPDATPDSTNPNKLIDFLTGVGEWDVDNDNDGRADSIWINANLPQFEDRRRSTLKRTLVQPLIAVLIRDLDGLLNVNVHGNATHLDPDIDNLTKALNSDGAYNSGVRGLGMGSAEVRLDLAEVLGTNLFREILGARHVNSSNSDHPASVNPNAYAGIHAGVAGMGRLYPDFWGFSPIAFEPMGYRIFDIGSYELYRNNPYMTNVYSNEGNPFKVEELEIFLRSQNDVDEKQFAHELKDLFDKVGVDPKIYRYFITTHSSNIPAMSSYGGNDIGGNPYVCFDLYERIRKLVGTTLPDNEIIANAIIKNLPPEIRRGEKINLNKVTNMTLAEKSEFAHQIYLLLMVLCNIDTYDYANSESGLAGNASDRPKKIQVIKTRLAQWSVNLVDFIDADAVMTPMVFSLDTFKDADYWKNDGNEYRNYFSKFINGQSTTWNDNMRIVFGKEDNDLFITKTFAAHNRNTADSKKDNEDPCTGSGSCGKAKGYVNDTCTLVGVHDKHFDQIFKPEGSFYVELYRAGDPTRLKTTGEFYTTDNGLDLARLNINDEPVWRIAIGNVTRDTPTESPSKGIIWELDQSDKSDYRFQPYQWFSDSDPTTNNEQISFVGSTKIRPERFIFFTDENATKKLQRADTDLSKRSFVNKGTAKPQTSTSGKKVGVYDTANTVLEPNSFFLIAPRVLTSFQSKVVVDESTDKFGTLPDDYSNTSIDLASTSTIVDNPRVKTMIAAIDASELTSDWNTTNTQILALGFRETNDALNTTRRGIGLNISEQLPTDANMESTHTGGYYPVPVFESDRQKDYYEPTSEEFKKPNYEIKNYTSVSSSTSTNVEFTNGFGTIPAFRSIYLQRLADPQRQYHPVNNPYITVDWSLVDLHVFTSEKVKDHSGDEFAAPDATAHRKFEANDPLYFNIREWGTTGARLDADSTRPNIRDRSFVLIPSTNKIIEDVSKIGNKMDKNYDPPKLPSGTDDPKPQWGILPKNYGSTNDGSSIPQLKGIPTQGFVHFPWNDSPLASTFELMLVPTTNPARFGYECYDSKTTYTLKEGGAGSLGLNIYNRFKNPDERMSPYLNFLTSKQSSSVNLSLNLVRLFEYVRVPSRFINTNQPLQAMREPGKININTMTGQSWMALGGDATSYTNVIQAKRNDGFLFAKPFRSPNAVNVRPRASEMAQTPADATLFGLSPMIPRDPESGDNFYTSMHHMIRLSEMTTTRSNVFAVWITTGYFRVDENKQLCEEIGTDDGTVERHRDFYIIDRSIPVGFIRGEKLNTRNVIIHKKSLE